MIGDPIAADVVSIELEGVASRLRAAYREGPVAPLRDVLSRHAIDEAYTVQNINVRNWIREGRRIVGRKIGLTSAALQAKLGVTEPDHGVLFADREIPDGGQIGIAHALQPLAEGEVAIIFAQDLPSPEPTVEDVMAVATAAVAIEIADSRIADWAIEAADTIADNASAGYFVLGAERRPLTRLDLWSCGMVMERNGVVVGLGEGAGAFGHPLAATMWLVRALAARGESLRAGDIVLTGALAPPVPLSAGDEIRVTVGGLGSCRFRYGAPRAGSGR